MLIGTIFHLHQEIKNCFQVTMLNFSFVFLYNMGKSEAKFYLIIVSYKMWIHTILTRRSDKSQTNWETLLKLILIALIMKINLFM